jgi:hypothetical protein
LIDSSFGRVWMDVRPEVLLDELKRLRKGRGVHHPSVSKHFGRALRAVCGITDPAAPPSVLRAGLDQTIHDLLSDEPEALVVMRAAVGLEPEGRLEDFDTLEQRLAWAASAKLFVGPRTVRDRVDGALSLFAQSAAANASRLTRAGEDPGFVLDDFRVQLPFFGERPVVVEERKIRSARDGLSIVRLRRGVRPTPEGNVHGRPFEIRIREGGRLLGVERRPGYLAYSVKLDKRLALGEVHKLVVELAPSADQPMASHYVVQPIMSFESFTVVARFDLRKLPERVWRVNGVPQGEIGIFRPDDELLVPDAEGKVETTFLGLHDGRSYGIAWDWVPVGEGP